MTTKLYKIGGKVFRLDKDLYSMARKYGVTRQEIEQEYAFMTRITPGFKLVNYNHATYSAIVKRSRGKSIWRL